MGKRYSKQKIRLLQHQLGGERTARINSEKSVIDLKRDIRKMEIKSRKPEERREMVIESSHQPHETEKPKKVVISIDGVNASGKSRLISKITEAFDTVGYTSYTLIKESRLAQSPYPQMREDAKKNRAHRDYREREKEVGLIVTAGRMGGGRAELVARLNTEGIAILDRYVWSTMAHQLSTGATFDEVIGMIASSYILPDESVILTCDSKVARQRSSARYRAEGRPIDDLDDLEKRANGFITLVGYDCVPHMSHYDTTNISEYELVKTVVTEIIGKHLPPEIIEKMLEGITSKYSGREQDKIGNGSN